MRQKHFPLIEDKENRSICAACIRKCCERYPGTAFPKDFGTKRADVLAAVRAAIETGHYCFDWWEGDLLGGDAGRYRTLFVRPATKNRIGVVEDPSWGGACTFLSVEGCALDFEKRPYGCR